MPQVHDCWQNKKELAISKKKFKSVKSWEDLVNVWVLFYSDDICIPTYASTFTGHGKEGITKYSDNVSSALKSGANLARFSKHTQIIFDNGQPGDENQRAYLTGFVPK